ncbi:MAG: hypothetical protein ACRELY_05035 [Polyangiaceae bacterium]
MTTAVLSGKADRSNLTRDADLKECEFLLKPLRGSQACVDAFTSANCTDLTNDIWVTFPAACIASCGPVDPNQNASSCNGSNSETLCTAHSEQPVPGGGSVTPVYWYSYTVDCTDECQVTGSSSSDGCVGSECKCRP